MSWTTFRSQARQLLLIGVIAPVFYPEPCFSIIMVYSLFSFLNILAWSLSFKLLSANELDRISMSRCSNPCSSSLFSLRSSSSFIFLNHIPKSFRVYSRSSLSALESMNGLSFSKIESTSTLPVEPPMFVFKSVYSSCFTICSRAVTRVSVSVAPLISKCTRRSIMSGMRWSSARSSLSSTSDWACLECSSSLSSLNFSQIAAICSLSKESLDLLNYLLLLAVMWFCSHSITILLWFSSTLARRSCTLAES
jgi:hypothetical protein